MKNLVVIFLSCIFLISCISKEEGAIADYVQRIDNVKTDMNFKTISKTILGDITAKDSVVILEKQFGEELKSDLDSLYKKKENDEMRVSYEKQYAANNQPYNDITDRIYWEKAIKEKENILEETNRQIKLYESDCLGTRLEHYVLEIKHYKGLGEKILAIRVNCSFSIINPLLNNAKQELTGIFILTPSFDRVITVEKS